MASTFVGLSIATRGLYTSQGGLLTTTNNISNVNTEGYSRQTVQQSAVATTNRDNRLNYNGCGSQITAISRVRDATLDNKYWSESTSLGEWKAKEAVLVEMEGLFGQAPGNDLSELMDQFYGTMEDLAADPGGSSARTVMRQSASSICQYLGSLSNQLTKVRNELNGDVKIAIDEINRYAEQIAVFNQRIREAVVAGVPSNQLEDERDLAIDHLSKTVGIDIQENVIGKHDDGTAIKSLSILVDGNNLVSGVTARNLECYTITGGGSQNGMAGIRWEDNGLEFTSEGGELNAYLELRDENGVGGSTKGAPYYSKQLDDFARTFAKAFNEGVYADNATYYGGHSSGAGEDGSTGTRFFSFDGKSSVDLMASGADLEAVYAQITASNISLSQDVAEDINKIAVASTAGGAENNQNLHNLLSICKDSRMFDEGAPDDFICAIVSTIGSDSAYAQKISTNSSNLVKNISDRRTSISGVSIDEETANLTKYQQVYNASAKMVNVWSQIYQETINLLS